MTPAEVGTLVDEAEAITRRRLTTFDESRRLAIRRLIAQQLLARLRREGLLLTINR